MTFFEWLAYALFGRHWLFYRFKLEYKVDLHIKEVDLKYQMRRADEARARKTKLDTQLAELREKPLDEVDASVTGKERYDAEKAIREQRAEEEKVLENRIKSAEQESFAADGEVGRLNASIYSLRRRWDFFKERGFEPSYIDRS